MRSLYSGENRFLTQGRIPAGSSCGFLIGRDGVNDHEVKPQARRPRGLTAILLVFVLFSFIVNKGLVLLLRFPENVWVGVGKQYGLLQGHIGSGPEQGS